MRMIQRLEDFSSLLKTSAAIGVDRQRLGQDLDGRGAEVPALRDVVVDDVNHCTITLSKRGARVVADVIRS
jgi:hypothetical protein